MNCPSCSKKVAGSYEVGSYSCSGCGGQIQVNPARPKHVQFGTEGANKRWGKTKATTSKKKASKKKNPDRYQVVVGNMGTLYDGDDLEEARDFYDQYVAQSEGGTGRAGNEDVTLFEDGEPVMEHSGGGENGYWDEDNPARHKHVAFGKEGADKRWGKSKATSSKKKAKKNPVERLPGWSAPEFLRKYGRGSGSGSAKEWAEELKFEHPTNRQMVVGLVADLLYQMDTSQVDARNQGSAAFLKRYQEWMEGPSAGVSTSPNVRFPFI